jgi:hypothetical protein
VASPCPSRAPPMEIQVASTASDHVQSRVAEIVTVPAPPLDANEAGVFDTDNEHLSADGERREVDAEVFVQPDADIAVARPMAIVTALSKRMRFTTGAT